MTDPQVTQADRDVAKHLCSFRSVRHKVFTDKEQQGCCEDCQPIALELAKVREEACAQQRELREAFEVEVARRLYREWSTKNERIELKWTNLWDTLSKERPELHRVSKPYWLGKARRALEDNKIPLSGSIKIKRRKT